VRTNADAQASKTVTDKKDENLHVFCSGWAGMESVPQVRRRPHRRR
jgi:hypothetical protein